MKFNYIKGKYLIREFIQHWDIIKILIRLIFNSLKIKMVKFAKNMIIKDNKVLNLNHCNQYYHSKHNA